MHSTQSRALFLRGLARKILKVSYFEIESGGTFCKVHTVMSIFHDNVIVPTALHVTGSAKTKHNSAIQIFFSIGEVFFSNTLGKLLHILKKSINLFTRLVLSEGRGQQLKLQYQLMRRRVIPCPITEEL